MKRMTESEEVFEAYARIDYCHFMLQKLAEPYIGKPNRSPIEIMVDNAINTSFSKRTLKTVKELLEEIISSKKIIDADYSKDEDFLNQLKNIIKSVMS